MREWHARKIPCTLLVNGNGAHLRISPLSFKIAELVLQLKEPETPVLYFFCGQDVSLGGSPLHLIRSLTGQLLEYYDFHLTNPREWDEALFSETTMLCVLFRSLVMQIPHSTSLVILIDGITWLEQEGTPEEICFVVEQLHQISQDAHALLKILIMAPGGCSYVARVFQRAASGGGGRGGEGQEFDEDTRLAVLEAPADGGSTQIDEPDWKGGLTPSLTDLRSTAGRAPQEIRKVRSLEWVGGLLALNVGDDGDYNLD